MDNEEVYICVNCKSIWVGIFDKCVNCGGQTMEKTHKSNVEYAENKEQPMMGIIGAGGTGLIAANIPSTFGVSDKKEEPNLKSEYLGNDFHSYLVTDEILRLPNYYEGKQFKCKGKHQYREVDGVWVCECGRKMND